MEFPAFQSIRATATGGIVTLTLDDAASRNALSGALVGEFDAALAVAAAEGARGLVVRGANGVFSAGGDVKAMMAALATPPDEGAVDPIATLNAAGGTFFARYAALPFFTIAIVDGMAAGGGVGLAAASDFVIATPSARFALTETGLGLVPAQIAPYLAARLGRVKALQLALTCRRLDGPAAVALGLADLVADDVEAALATLVGELRQSAPGAIAATKRLFARAAPGPAFIEEAAGVFAAAVRGPEAAEGISAFLARRAPRWKGAE